MLKNLFEEIAKYVILCLKRYETGEEFHAENDHEETRTFG